MTALIPRKQHSSRLSEAKKSLGHFSDRGMLRVMPSDIAEEILFRRQNSKLGLAGVSLEGDEIFWN